MLKNSSISLILGFLIFGGISIRAQDIFVASKEGKLDLVKNIIESNPQQIHSKDNYGRTPLHYAARGVHFEVMQYLLSKGAEVNSADTYAGISPIHSVATRGHLDALNLLIKNGAKLNIQNKFAAHD